MTTKQVSEKLNSKCVSNSKGVFRYWKSYYWGFTGLGEIRLKEKVLTIFPNAKVIETGNHFHTFVGDVKSGSPQDSYFYVKFVFPGFQPLN